MDTSGTYIKMSAEAGKFLPKWQPEDGDFFACKNPLYADAPAQIHVWTELYLGAEDNRDCFPLYRQDQLQEMVGEESEVMLLEYILCFVFDTTKHWWQIEYTKQFDSMEQLWLAFVLKELYSKIWNGEEWVTS